MGCVLLQFLVRAIHGLVPVDNMAAPWGPKLISTFKGHMDLHHPVKEENVIYLILAIYHVRFGKYFIFLVQAIHGLAPGAKMAPPRVQN